MKEILSEILGNPTHHEHLSGLLDEHDVFWVKNHQPATIELIAAAIKNRCPGYLRPPKAAPGIFRFSVDYGQEFSCRVASGYYDAVGKGIERKRFPISGEGVVEFAGIYLPANGNNSSEAVLRKIRQMNKEYPWASPDSAQLLAFGAAFPDEQRRYPIPGLAAKSVSGPLTCLCLIAEAYERQLVEKPFTGNWPSNTKFLAVRPIFS